MLPESIIFDVDGTLWDSVALVAESWNLALESMGLPGSCTEANIRPLFGKTMEQIAEALMPDLPKNEREAKMERFMEYENVYLAAHPCRVFYPGIADTMEQLSKHHRLFIVSNCQQGYIEICMDKGGFCSCIRDHACFGDTKTCKGETIRTIMTRNAVTEAVYVGDTQGDLEAAQYAGIPFIWASYGFGQPEQWDERIEAFPELLTR